MRRWATTIGVAAGLLLASAMAGAQDTGVTLRFRGIFDRPAGSGGAIPGTGTTMTVDNAVAPEFDATVKFHRNVGVEVAFSTWRNNNTTEGGMIGGVKTGAVRIIPFVVTVQYHPATGDSPLKPYVGAGIHRTSYRDTAPSAEFAAIGVANLSPSGSTGFVLQGGLDFALPGRWVVNADLKYLRTRTDLTVTTVFGTTMPVFSVVVDPWVLGLGFGYRF